MESFLDDNQLLNYTLEGAQLLDMPTNDYFSPQSPLSDISTAVDEESGISHHSGSDSDDTGSPNNPSSYGLADDSHVVKFEPDVKLEYDPMVSAATSAGSIPRKPSFATVPIDSRKRKSTDSAEPALLVPELKPSVHMLPTAVPTPTVGSSKLEAGFSKREMRLIKNREAASLSRKRRKEYVAALEERLQAVLAENEMLKHRLAQYEPVPSSIDQGSPILPAPVTLSKGTAKHKVQVGLLMCFIFFMIAIPVFVHQPGSISPAITRGGRSLHSVSPSVARPMAVQVPSTPSTSDYNPRENSSSKPYVSVTPFDGNFTESHTVVETTDLRSWLDQAVHESRNPPSHPEHKELALTHARQYSGGSVDSGDPTFFVRQPDTAYMFCSQVHQVLPNEKTLRGAPKMSLLLPADGSGMFAGDHYNHKNSLIQIDCQVLGTRLVTIPLSPVPMTIHNTTEQ